MVETEIIQQSIYKSLDNYYCHHKDNHNPLHHQHYRHRINYLPLFISMFQLTIYSSLL